MRVSLSFARLPLGMVWRRVPRWTKVDSCTSLDFSAQGHRPSLDWLCWKPRRWSCLSLYAARIREWVVSFHRHSPSCLISEAGKHQSFLVSSSSQSNCKRSLSPACSHPDAKETPPITSAVLCASSASWSPAQRLPAPGCPRARILQPVSWSVRFPPRRSAHCT